MGHCQGLPKNELLQLLWEISWIEIIVSSVKDLTVNGNKSTSASYVVLLLFTPHDLIFYSSCWEERRKGLQYLEVSFIKLSLIFLEGFSSASLYHLVSARGIAPACGICSFASKILSVITSYSHFVRQLPLNASIPLQVLSNRITLLYTGSKIQSISFFLKTAVDLVIDASIFCLWDIRVVEFLSLLKNWVKYQLQGTSTVHLYSYSLPPLAVANLRYSFRLLPLVDYQVTFSTDRKLIEKHYCDKIVF